MLYAIYSIAAFVLLVLIILGIGASLPKAHVASVAARYKQPPEVVYDAISNWREYKSWRAGLRFVREREGTEGRVSWSEASRTGELPVEVLEADRPRKFVTKIASDKLPFGGTWTFDIAPTTEGCTLTITESGEVYNLFFRFMAHFFFGYESTIKSYHADLSRKLGQACELVSG